MCVKRAYIPVGICAHYQFTHSYTYPRINTHIHSTSGFIRMLQMNEQGLKKHTCLYFISRTIQSTKHPHTACIFVVVLSVSFYSCYNCSTSNIVCNKNSK